MEDNRMAFDFEEKYQLTSVINNILDSCRQEKKLKLNDEDLKNIDEAVKKDFKSLTDIDQINLLLHGVQFEKPEDFYFKKTRNQVDNVSGKRKNYI